MPGTLLVLLLLAALAIALILSARRSRQRELAEAAAELEPVKKLAFEDVTALGEELQSLDADLIGRPLDEGERADYQRALDAYEAAKTAAEAMAAPDDIRHVTTILDDGRYAIACVRARVAGEALPTRRPPCFFDPRHGLSVTDVTWAPAGGVPRDVPACALDAERVRAGAEPDTRQVMVGPQRVPYWQGGPAFAPYAAGYFASYGVMNWLMMGLMFDAAFGGFDGGFDGAGDSGGDAGDAGGDYGDSAGDSGGGDFGGGDFGGGDFGGGDFGGF